ncbi:MAG: hypothetical protein M1831_001826 [Alyxoria varia]|nr:MAG: hypothetical protein M1831_001826 [Alyxoria varia]
MVYDWKDKKDECYRLYVEERKSLHEVMQYFKAKYNFEPSKRAFQTNFKRWNFPSKQSPAHKNEELVDRIRDLWQNNASQKQMREILQNEGFDINERDLMRVRVRNNWFLRGTNGFHAKKTGPGSGRKRKRDTDNEEEEYLDELEKAAEEEETNIREAQDVNEVEQHDQRIEEAASPNKPSIPPEKQLQKQQRRQQIEAESAELWAAKKRRRRTRGFAGLPADPPGPPRFPSETTLDESKSFLRLDNDLYRQVREQFTEICDEAGVIKKTSAGPEKWAAVKEQLIQDSPHLYKEFYGPDTGVPVERKRLALDVISLDVTKRMRTIGSRMGLADAKNALRLNPEESRIVRSQFYNVLANDYFTSKVEAGTEHWNELKQQWINNSPQMQKLYEEQWPPGDTRIAEREKAINVVCKDVMKRVRDDQVKRDPSTKRHLVEGPGPGPARPQAAATKPKRSSASATPFSPALATPSPSKRQKTQTPQSSRKRQPEATVPSAPQTLPQPAKPVVQDSQIDPSLAGAASDPTLALQAYAATVAASQTSPYQPQHHQQHTQPSHAQPLPTNPFENLHGQPGVTASGTATGIPLSQERPTAAPTAAMATSTNTSPQQPRPFGACFRLHPCSSVQTQPVIWMSTLLAPTLHELFQKAGDKHGEGAGVRVRGVEGQMPEGGTFPLQMDDELVAYLECVAKGRPTFLVDLVQIAGHEGHAGKEEDVDAQGDEDEEEEMVA